MNFQDTGSILLLYSFALIVFKLEHMKRAFVQTHTAANNDTLLPPGSGGGLGTGGLALAYQCQQSGRVRACVESVLVLSLMKKLGPLLEAEELMSAFTKVSVLLLPSTCM